MAKRFGCGPQSMKTAVDRPSEKRHSKPNRVVAFDEGCETTTDMVFNQR